MKRSPHLSTRILSLHRGLNGVQSHVPSRQSQQHPVSLKIAPAMRTGQSVNSKDRGGGEGPLSALVQLDGQPVVMSNRRFYVVGFAQVHPKLLYPGPIRVCFLLTAPEDAFISFHVQESNTVYGMIQYAHHVEAEFWGEAQHPSVRTCAEDSSTNKCLLKSDILSLNIQRCIAQSKRSFFPLRT